MIGYAERLRSSSMVQVSVGDDAAADRFDRSVTLFYSVLVNPM